MKKAKVLLKRIVAVALCVCSISSAVIASIPVAKASGTSILGTNEALGSPVLNNNFLLEDWNKWEMVCWGVFLSNFCQPLIDDYQSAFQTTGSGSNGAGYKALCFGSGSDQTNNETIEKLCNYAIAQSQAGNNTVYVAYTELKKTKQPDGTEVGQLGKKKDPNKDDKVVRQAHFRDFFFQMQEDDGTTDDANASTDPNSTSGTSGSTTQDDSTWANSNDTTYPSGTLKEYQLEEYNKLAMLKEGKVPTFYIKNTEGKYVKLLDYTNPWDVQMISLMMNAVRNSDYKKSFVKNFESYWSSNPAVTADPFANIMVSKKMLIPACVNQNITTDKQVNLINSWVMNHYTNTYTDQQILLGLRQNNNALLGTENLLFEPYQAGYPALGETNIGSVALMYYDTDTIVAQAYLNNNKVPYYGNTLLTLFSQNATKNKHKYTPKIEIAGNGARTKKWFQSTTDVDAVITNTLYVCSLLPNVLKYKDTNIINYIEDFQGNKVNLMCDKPVAIPIQTLTSTVNNENKKGTNQGAVRNFYNTLYQAYSGKLKYSADMDSDGKMDKTSITDELTDTTFNDFKNKVVEDRLFKKFKKIDTRYKKVGNLAGMWREFFDSGNNETFNDEHNRVILAYPVSDVMKNVSNVLGVEDGTEFSVYSTMIYMTYLNWYGVTSTNTMATGTEKTSKFSTDIYSDNLDILKYDPSADINAKSEEDMEKEVLQYGYLMLHPEDGRSYRKTMALNGLADWMYEEYNRICYGGSDSAYNGTASRSNSGFLAVQSYKENFLTKPVLNAYANFSVWAIAICGILIVLVGILKHRKATWYLLSFMFAFNAILLVPASGDIVPYITSNFVQNMFSSKMTYWSISQGITNAAAEKEAASGNLDSSSDLTSEEAQEVVKLVKQLNNVYTDRSLMVKQDISQKVTQKVSSSYSSIQQLQSARWLLPMIMQQFSGDNGNEENYIYKPLSNIWDDMSNFYWFYKPQDATFTNASSPTTTSGQQTADQQAADDSSASGTTSTTSTTSTTGTTSSSGSGSTSSGTASSSGSGSSDTTTGTGNATYKSISEKYSEIGAIYADHKNTNNAEQTGVHYKCYCYEVNGGSDSLVHTVAYYLPRGTRQIVSRGSDFVSNYKNVDSWQSYIDKASKTSGDQWRTDVDNGDIPGFETTADSYDRTDRSSITEDMEFLVNTESPMYYMYNTVKDTFDNSKTLGYLIGQLQGNIKSTTDSKGNTHDVRDNFMYATRSDGSTTNSTGQLTDDEASNNYTGWVRDVVDLEEMFNNMIPYMYQVQLETGGFDGVSGVLKDKEVTDKLPMYEGTKQSWLYRSNWVTKIMENPEYSKPEMASTADGKSFTVNNPVLPESYTDRDMVFSEAQQKAAGLSDDDLTLVELKCVECNKKIAKQWTLLINYAGTSGLTKEVLYRQMATDAALIFCDEFSTSGILNTKYDLYPQSLDLRYISFDSVMKMLVMNISKDTSYSYGNTMSTLITNESVVTGVFLLIDALVCSYVISFIRVILMALIFYLGFVAMLQSIFSSGKAKAKVACGQITQNVLFCGLTVLYYALFALMMKISSNDEVLSINSVQTSAGNPVWMLIVILVISIVYALLMIKMIKFCVLTYRDMGFAAMSMVASGIVGRLRDTIGGLGDKISDSFNGIAESDETSRTDSIEGSGNMEGQAQDVNVVEANNQTIKIENTTKDEDQQSSDVYNGAYSSGDIDNVDETGGMTAEDIDAQIRAGQEIESDS